MVRKNIESLETNGSQIVTESFVPAGRLRSPVLFLVFNRPDTTERVFQAIRKAKPSRLYVACDGPRKGVDADDINISRVRDIIGSVDWQCDVQTLFRQRNVGPMHAQVGAFDWFFSQEEEGIVLEDDCLPSQSFFWYCDELLNRYREDERIFLISGNNFQGGPQSKGASYYFSIYPHNWGFATWKRAWSKYDADISEWPNFKKSDRFESLNLPSRTKAYWCDLFDRIYTGEYSRGWDFRFAYASWKNGALSVLPNVNLVSNIGHGVNATNCFDPQSPFANLTSYELRFPLTHPGVVERTLEADARTGREMFHKKSFAEKIMRRISLPQNPIDKVFKRFR